MEWMIGSDGLRLPFGQPPFQTGQICRETGYYVSLCAHGTSIRLYDGWVFPLCPVGPHPTEWARSLIQGVG